MTILVFYKNIRVIPYTRHKKGIKKQEPKVSENEIKQEKEWYVAINGKEYGP